MQPLPSPTPIRAVAFDLGGVLVDWDRRHLYRRVFDGDEAAMERFLAEVCTMEWNATVDAGRPFREAVENLAALHPAQRGPILAYHERWPEMLGGAIDGSVAILDELRAAGVPCYALSNWSAETFPVARARFPFLDWFDGTLLSGEIGVVKPDPRIFRAFLGRFGLDPRATLYVDDTAANVDAAASLGFQARLFCGAAALRDDLQEVGLLRTG